MESFEKFTKYRKLMISLIQEPISESIQEKTLEEIGRVVHSEKNKVKIKIFNGFAEIIGSMETLDLIEKFVSISPPEVEGINYSNYLHYHVHNYVQEVYILKERLNAYLTLIKRLLPKVVQKELETQIESLFTLIQKPLQNIAGDGGVRNKHVHQKKYSDNGLNWLNSTSFLSEYKSKYNSEYKEDFIIESKKAYFIEKEKWTKTINKNNEEVKILLDIYFGIICDDLVSQLDILK